MKDKKNSLEISARRAALYSSFSIGALAVVFFLGFSCGRIYQTEEYITQLEQDSFADSVTASLFALYKPEQKQEAVASAAAPTESVQSELEDSDIQAPSSFYAQLIGYGTLKSAESFAKSLQEKGIPAKVKNRISVTAQGEERAWYQVVTESFEDKNELEQLAHRVSQQENIQGIQIVPC